MPGPSLQLAILFWFYKDEAVCVNRLRHLRRLNPDTPIYGLYGGPLSGAERFQRMLPELDDFWACPDPSAKLSAALPATEGKEDLAAASYWSWRNGDLRIRLWHEARGQHLAWDTIFVAQWDLLVTEPVEELVPVHRDEFIVSGLRPISEVESWWMWTQGEHRAEYEQFLEHVRDDLGYHGEPYACQFVAVYFPRSFLDRFVEVASPELGFLEYKLPTYAAAFGNSLTRSPRLQAWWIQDPETAKQSRSTRLLKAGGAPIRLRWVKTHPSRGIYHPFEEEYPEGQWASPPALMAEFARDVSLLAMHPKRSWRAP